jgi:hypothetical protein
MITSLRASLLNSKSDEKKKRFLVISVHTIGSYEDILKLYKEKEKYTRNVAQQKWRGRLPLPRIDLVESRSECQVCHAPYSAGRIKRENEFI